MTTDERTRAAIIDLVESIDVPPGAGVRARGTTSGRTGRYRRHRVVLAGVAAAVLLVVAVLAFGLSWPVQTPAPARVGGAPVLPERLPTYRIWGIPTQSSKPLSSVAMAWRFNGENEIPFFEPIHDVVLGEDLVSLRRVEAGPPVVSPNGRLLASGLHVDDLATGTSTDLASPPGTGEFTMTHPWGWSKDSRLLYVTTETDPSDPDDPTVWEVPLDGPPVRVGPAFDLWDLAPAPDGHRLAMVQRKGVVQIYDNRSRRITDTVDYEPPPGERPAGGWPMAQWTPDGTELLLVTGAGDVNGGSGTTVTIVDIASGRRRTARSEGFDCEPLTTLTQSTLLCRSSAATEPGVPRQDAPEGLTIFDLNTGERTVVAVAPKGPGMVQMSVADDLVRQWRFAMSKPWVAPAR